MKQINCNVSGNPAGDSPFIQDDSQPANIVHGAFEGSGRIVFRVPDNVNGGATLIWSMGSARFILPLAGYNGEGSELGIPTITYTPAPVQRDWTVVGSQFVQNGAVVKWKGITHFRLLQLSFFNDISDHLTQVQEAGFNLVRVVGMKTNNTGWDLNPATAPDYWGTLDRFFTKAKNRGLQVEFTAFADTLDVMPNPNDQQTYWRSLVSLVQEHSNVLIELVNEWNHPTQRINPQAFSKPDGITSSHGSGLTDSDGVQPYWDYMTYHARRNPPPDARGFTNYDQYEFQAVYPSLPRIPDEGIKPEAYGYDTGYAKLLGAHAALGAGGTFHWSGGVNGEMMTNPIYNCAVSFNLAIR